MKKFLSVLIFAMLCTGVTAFAQTNTQSVTVMPSQYQIASSGSKLYLVPVSTSLPVSTSTYTSQTLQNLMTAITGEVTANAKYIAFSNQAAKEGYTGVAGVFRAISDAELKHAQDEFKVVQSMNPSAVMPKPESFTVGTTKENLQAAIDGESYEYTTMYPTFAAQALKENNAGARNIFTLARLAEQKHASIYADLLKNIDNFDTVKYGTIYRCPDCGNIITRLRPEACNICGNGGATLVEYKII